MMKKLQAAVLSLSLLVPASSAFAVTHHHHVRHATHHHHYSRTRGTAVGAVAGALIDHHHPLTGAVVGGALGNLVQNARNHH
jgi:uncharacterized protein YcfJ